MHFYVDLVLYIRSFYSIYIYNLPNKLVHVPTLLRNLSRDLIGAHRVIVRLFAEAEIVSQVHQRHGNPEPHTQKSKHGGERYLGEKWGFLLKQYLHTNRAWLVTTDWRGRTYGSGWVLAPNETVQHKTDGKDDGRVQSRSLKEEHKWANTWK